MSIHNRLRRLKLTKIDLVDHGAAIGARVTLAKQRIIKEDHYMTLEEVLASLDSEKKAVIMAALEAAAQKAPVTKPDMPDEEKKEEAMKLLPEYLRKQIDADREAVRVAKREADEARERIAKLEDDNLTREYVLKAKSFEAIPVLSADELGQVLKSVDTGKAITKDLSAKLMQSFAATTEIVRKSKLFEIHGSHGGHDADSPLAKLKSVAKRLKEQDPKLTDAAALALARDQNPDLYIEYRNGARS